jgi:hypothetical protein
MDYSLFTKKMLMDMLSILLLNTLGIEIEIRLKLSHRL